MRICFYTTFKPTKNKIHSIDSAVSTGLGRYLETQKHKLQNVNFLCLKHIFWKPWKWLSISINRKKALAIALKFKSDVWITNHTCHKYPDVIGPFVSNKLNIPYVIFKGTYCAQKGKNLITWPGYILNKKALATAKHIFVNSLEELTNLRSILPDDHLSYITPGIYSKNFWFDQRAKKEWRQKWEINKEIVILTAGEFVPGGKTEELIWVIRACGELFRKGRKLHLVIVGDGKERNRIKSMARAHLPSAVHFTGNIDQNEMYKIYSAADIFVFPGIEKPLSMVFLEAQSCGLPIVAFDIGGTPEVVEREKTGLLTTAFDFSDFVHSIDVLIKNKEKREHMGRNAKIYVRKFHDLYENYNKIEQELEKIASLDNIDTQTTPQ